MTTTIQNNEFWQTKLLARIHDPAEKALVLMNTTEGHEGGTVADLKKEFFNQDQISKLYPIVQKADHWAAAAVFLNTASSPYLSRARTQPCETNIRMNFVRPSRMHTK